MQGAKDLIASERGIFCLLVLICATGLAVVKVISGNDWLDFVKLLTITLVGSKTATTVSEIIKGKAEPVQPPTSAP